MDKLVVVIPVYNEQDAIQKVLEKWSTQLDSLQIDYKIFAYNDGSKDNTAEILNEISKSNPNVIAINKPNSGHGPTILKGYKDNAPDFDWIFQTDSDDETEAADFNKLWEKRNDYDFLIGRRNDRVQVITRKIVSFFSRLCISMFYGKGVWDANSPYRLMRSEKFVEIFNQIPENVFSPNVMISGIVSKKKMKFIEIPISSKQRQTGEVSIQKLKLLKAAINSFWQCMIFSFKVK